VVIPSASEIPFQQKEWLSEAVRLAAAEPQSLLSRLPLELLDHVVDLAGYMTRQEAEKYRSELIEERTVFIKTLDNARFL